MAIHEDRWLSERFGHPVLSVPPGDAAGLAEHAAGRSGVSYQARVDVADVAAVAALEAAGMRTVNVTVTLACAPEPVPGAGDEGVEVRDADPAADTALLDVAARSFRYSRFHLDPAVPDEVANRVKRDWVGSYLQGIRGEQLLVAVRDGEPVGFLAVIAREEDGRRVRVIDLVAVAPEARRTGAGRALVRRFHEQSAGRCDAVEVGTQLANPPALRFYEKLGYTAERAAYDLHMHL